MARSMTSTQVSQLFEVSTRTLYLWESAGKIPRPVRDRRGWRVYSPKQIEAIRRFAGPPRPADAPLPAQEGALNLSGLTARNQVRGRVVSVLADGLLCEVVLRLGDGQEIVAIVTRSSMKRLGLKKGQDATAVIKATEVMLFK